MHIAFYAPMKPPAANVPSGDRTMARVLIKALEAAGQTVTVASALRAYDGAGNRAYQKRIATEGGAQARRLVEMWRNNGADLPDAWITYHSYYKSPDWIGPAVARQLALPYVIVEPSHAEKRRHDPRWSLNHAQAELAIRSADALLPMTARDEEGVAPLARPGARVIRLAPFIDPDPFVNASQGGASHRRRWRERLGLGEREPLLLAVAMMRPGVKAESYRALGAALGELADLKWTLAVAGDGPARTDVQAALAALGEARVRWLGRVPDREMPGLYAAGDLLVWPGCDEAYGIAYLEAAAAGIATAAFRSGGVPAVVADGITGLLAPDGDIAAFGGIIRTLMVDTRLRLELGAAGADMVRRERNLAVAGATLTALLARRQPNAGAQA